MIFLCLFGFFGELVYLYLVFVSFFRCEYRLVSRLDSLSCIIKTHLNLLHFSMTDVNLKCKGKGAFGEKNK